MAYYYWVKQGTPVPFFYTMSREMLTIYRAFFEKEIEEIKNLNKPHK